MVECVYNYSLEDNLNATKHLFILKNKRKTNIVGLLLIFFTIIGVMASIGAIITKSNYWYVGIISVGLLTCYFLIDKVMLSRVLDKQKEFYYANLKDVTKIKIKLENDVLTETFLIKEKVVGANSYKKTDLTAVKITPENVYFIFKDEFVVLIKKACTTEKIYYEFLNFAENILNKKVKK